MERELNFRSFRKITFANPSAYLAIDIVFDMPKNEA